MLSTNPPRRLTRCLCLCTLVLLLLGGVLSAGRAGAGEAGPAAQVVSLGVRPTTETMRRMVARDAHYRAVARTYAERAAQLPRRAEDSTPERRLGRVEAAEGQDDVHLPPVEAAEAQSVGTGFEGIDASQVGGVNTTPTPDSTGAMGPDHYVEIVNNLVVIYSRAGAQLSSVTGSNFFNVDAGGITFPRQGIDYLRVLYDQHSGRWFTCGVERSNGEFNHAVLAVSRTSSPLGTWDKYLVMIGQGADASSRYHTVWSTLGVDDNGVYVGALLERVSLQNGDTQELIPVLTCAVKSKLIAATPTLGATFRFTLGSQNRWGPPQVPHNLDAIGPQAPAYVINSPATTRNQVIFSTLTWNAGTPALSGPSSVLTAAYGLVPLGASLDSNSNLILGDDRLQGSMIRNGRLWTCRTVGVNAGGGATNVDRAGCEWLELQTAPAGTLSLVQSGLVYTPQAGPRAYFQPSLAVSGQGHMALGFHGARGGERIGFYTCGRLAGDQPGTIGAPMLVRSGAAAWLYNQSGNSPWGRLTQTCVDPNDDQTLWTLGNYAKSQGGTGIWGSRVSPLTAPAPQLTGATNAVGFQGQTGASFTLTGAGFFDPGAGFPNRPQVTLSGTGVSNVAVTVNSATSATVTLNLAADAPLGTRNVTFTNPDGQSAARTNALTVSVVPVVQFESATYAATEEGQAPFVTLVRTGSIGVTTSVQVDFSGTAGAGTDYETALSGMETFLPFFGSLEYATNATADFLLEGDETINLSLSNIQNGVLGPQVTTVVTIVDDLDRPKPTNLTAVVTGGQVALQWEDHCDNEDGYRVEVTSDGGATYQTAGTTGANATGTGVSGLTGGNRTFRVRAFRGAIQSEPSNTVFLQFAALQFSAVAFSGSEVTGTVPVTVTRTGFLNQAYTVRLSTGNGTAVAPGDYTAQTTTTVSFGPNETSHTVNIPVSADQLLEGDETLNLTLSNPTGTNVVLGAQAAAAATISDDPARCAPTNLTFSVANYLHLQWEDHCENEDRMVVVVSADGDPFELVLESNSTSFNVGLRGGVTYTVQVRAARTQVGLRSDPSNTVTVPLATVQFSADTFSGSEAGGMVPVTIARTGNLGSPASVVLSTGDDTATVPGDYTALTNTTVNFAVNEASRTVNLAVNADQALEGDETFYLFLNSPTGVNTILGGETTVTATIADDPAPCTPSNLAAALTGAGTIRLDWTDHCTNEDSFVVERSAGGEFATVATVGADVTTATDSTAPIGATLTYRVRAVKGALQSNNSTPVTTQALPALEFSAANYAGSEASGTVPVTISRGSAGLAASVTLSTGNGSAAAPADYTALFGTVVNFGAGEVVKTVTVVVNADQALEGDEAFSLTLSSPTGAVLGTQATATATITDNAAPATPTNVTALPVGPTIVRLAWADHCSNESGFQLERSSGGGAFTVVGAASANATSTQDTTATGGMAFTYRVRAVQGPLQGSASNEVQATIPLGAVVKITPAKLNFGKVKLGKTKTLKVTIQNTSKTGAMAGFVSLTGAAGYTLVGGDQPFTLLPKKKLVLSVSFAPPAVGTAAGTVTVLTTATNKPSTVIAMTGTGK